MAIYCRQCIAGLYPPALRAKAAWASCPPPRPDRLAFAPNCRAFFWVLSLFFTFGAIDGTGATLKTSRMYFSTLTSNKWLRGILWVVGGIAVLWGLAWMLVPTLVKNQLEKAASEQLGRKVTVGLIDFKPWTLELEINDLAIASQAGNSAQFKLKRLYVNAEMESLFRLAPVVQ